jgi:hypothetical protein
MARSSQRNTRAEELNAMGPRRVARYTVLMEEALRKIACFGDEGEWLFTSREIAREALSPNRERAS